MHSPAKGQLFAIYYPVLATFGVPANIAAIAILSRGRCGLSKCITWYLVFMAVTDLLVIITAVILNRIGGIYLQKSFLSTTSACRVSTVLIYSSRDSSVWLTVAFTFDRFVAICSQKVKKMYCTEKTAAVVIGTICILSCLKNIPFYFAYEPLYTINNVAWYCSRKLSFYLSSIWTAFVWFDRLLTPCLPFLMMLLLNALTVAHILGANRARKRLRAHSSGGNQSDPEMEKRRKSIVLLFTISGTFILLWLIYVINFLYGRITSTNYFNGFNFNNIKFVLQECGNMLQLLSCCTNACIYTVTQSKFRQELKNTVKYSLNLVTKVLHQ
ncbi:probable G-protein coupled receptor 139 [Heterodontus francisci]|uniref:probable G-protein coupled receptor 139 n=1 Tax=Heterodontus francisci TaxID=7792 RepID=UPI00355B73DD